MNLSDGPRISLLIPAWNEAEYLPRLLDTVDAARAAYARGPGAVEVIVVDNASTDATAAIAASRGCRVVREERRVIAAARNAGARAARGAILAFVDADSRIHPRTFDAVEASLATGRVVAGATGVTLERWSAGIAVTYAMLVPFVWLTGMDTGLVFCRREDFEAVGGYDESVLFAEDVRLLVSLWKLGRRRRQRLARLRRFKAIASTRKFDRHGDWHYIPLMLKGSALMLLPPRFAERFARRYWYEDPR